MKKVNWGWFCLAMLVAAEAGAQPYEPVSPFVLDARGAFARAKAEPVVASSLDVPVSNLPTRGLGLAVGAHWYPLRRRLVSVGLGAELAVARGRRTAEPTTTTTAGPTVTTHVSSLSPQISINFGKRDGWSYLSGGIGRGRMTAEREDRPSSGGAERTRALNYGGGARWFTGPHLAFSVDVRWYVISPRAATAVDAGFPRARLMVISAGISVH